MQNYIFVMYFYGEKEKKYLITLKIIIYETNC